ncbi:hypothetical protein HK101_007674, partial [Irineochytrium annulatum]
MLGTAITSIVLLASAAYARNPAHAGQTCGGIAGIPCDSGLTCHITSNVADATGVCEKENTGAQIGQTCGGFAGLKCATGLTCHITSNVADATGVCEKENSGAQIGQTCGGFAGLKCAAGLTCHITSNVADATGVCEKENTGAQIGQTCGGFAGLHCASGLECIITSSVADATGVCQKKVNAAKLGQTCGGIAGITCDSGLECIITSSAADATGVCRLAGAAINQFCGGLIGRQCASGLSCVITSPPNQSDASGLCKKVANLGQACGGNIADAAVCPSGLTCVRESHGGFMPVDQLQPADIGGTCLTLARTNESCGGNIKFPPVCQTGLLCKPRRHQKLPFPSPTMSKNDALDVDRAIRLLVAIHHQPPADSRSGSVAVPRSGESGTLRVDIVDVQREINKLSPIVHQLITNATLGPSANASPALAKGLPQALSPAVKEWVMLVLKRDWAEDGDAEVPAAVVATSAAGAANGAKRKKKGGRPGSPARPASPVSAAAISVQEWKHAIKALEARVLAGDSEQEGVVRGDWAEDLAALVSGRLASSVSETLGDGAADELLAVTMSDWAGLEDVATTTPVDADHPHVLKAVERVGTGLVLPLEKIKVLTTQQQEMRKQQHAQTLTVATVKSLELDISAYNDRLSSLIDRYRKPLVESVDIFADPVRSILAAIVHLESCSRELRDQAKLGKAIKAATTDGQPTSFDERWTERVVKRASSITLEDADAVWYDAMTAFANVQLRATTTIEQRAAELRDALAQFEASCGSSVEVLAARMRTLADDGSKVAALRAERYAVTDWLALERASIDSALGGYSKAALERWGSVKARMDELERLYRGNSAGVAATARGRIERVNNREFKKKVKELEDEVSKWRSWCAGDFVGRLRPVGREVMVLKLAKCVLEAWETARIFIGTAARNALMAEFAGGGEGGGQAFKAERAKVRARIGEGIRKGRAELNRVLYGLMAWEAIRAASDGKPTTLAEGSMGKAKAKKKKGKKASAAAGNGVAGDEDDEVEPDSVAVESAEISPTHATVKRGISFAESTPTPNDPVKHRDPVVAPAHSFVAEEQQVEVPVGRPAPAPIPARSTVGDRSTPSLALVHPTDSERPIPAPVPAHPTARDVNSINGHRTESVPPTPAPLRLTAQDIEEIRAPLRNEIQHLRQQHQNATEEHARSQQNARDMIDRLTRRVDELEMALSGAVAARNNNPAPPTRPPGMDGSGGDYNLFASGPLGQPHGAGIVPVMAPIAPGPFGSFIGVPPPGIGMNGRPLGSIGAQGTSGMGFNGRPAASPVSQGPPGIGMNGRLAASPVGQGPPGLGGS